MRSLSLANNQITDISPLSELVNLDILNLGINNITDISLLSELVNLKQLYLGNNKIYDISPLSGLVYLGILDLNFNNITDISPLSTLVKLEELRLWGNQITDISPLSGLVNLQGLFLVDNQITDISPLSNLTNLTWLELSGNQITNVSPLSNLTGLTRLWLAENQISDIGPLVTNYGLSEGDEIDLRGNPLSEESLNTYIPELEVRGVVVLYDVPGVEPEPDLVITSPLEITPVKEFYQPKDSLTARFTITNKGTELITFNVLVVGGRGPAGEIVDFDKAHNITLNPGDSYNYLGSLTLPDIVGRYHFFIVYQTPDGKWHSNINVEIDGQIVEGIEAARFTTRDILVRHREYIGIAPQIATWEEISGPWEKEGRRLSQIAVHPNNPEIIYVAVERFLEDGRLYRSINQ